MGVGAPSEIAIVGAGPAGAWAAWRLARAGARVTLFDHSHPREKPCGGGVTGRALQLISEAVPPSSLAGVASQTAEFDDPRTTPASVPLAAHGLSAASSLVIVDRRTFDRALLDAALEAGAQHVAERVTDVETSSAGASVRAGGDSYRASWIIGADGANSLVRRRLARPFSRRDLSIAVGYFAHGVASRDVLIRFVADPSGYIWSFPRRDHLAIGVCAQADEATSDSLRHTVSAWIASRGIANGARLEYYGWPIPSLPVDAFEAERPAGDRWLLAGDAAGLVDPITREGIFFALQSGQLAAESLCRSGSPARAYSSALRRHIYPELRRAARLKRGFFRGAFTHLLVDALRHSAAVRRVMTDLVAGQQPYATLKRRLVTTFELGLAWKLLMLELGRRT